MNKKKLDKSNIQDILGLTPMQEGMLFHYLSNSESKQYLEQLCLTLCGEIDEAIIKKAWNNVVQNNEMLRTIFKWDKLDKPLQIILKQYEIPYVQYDLSDINSLDKEAKIIDIKDSELNVKIDISENPLRMAIVKIDNSKFELIITYHHILYDGWSNGILLKEFVQDCNNLCTDRPLSIIKKNNFKEFVKYCKKQDKVMQEAFWRKHFIAYEINSTIESKHNKSEKFAEKSKINYKFNEHISKGIYEFCKKEKTTVAAMLYTAWGILLQKYNNTNDIVFGTTVSGRNAGIAGIEDMVGLFINTLPLRVNSNEGESVQSLLQKIDCILKERDEYQSTPLVDIKSYSGIDNKEELFDTLVVIENYPFDKELIRSDNFIRIEEYSMTEMTNYKITLAITDFKGLELALSYDTSAFYDAEIKRMVGHFENILVNIIENPTYSMSQIDILAEEERQQILTDFNNTKADYPKYKTIHKLFEEQVEKTPYSIAIVFEDKILTYRELNEKANQLARILRDKGVVPDSIVGIMIERSIEMIVGIIGILKAGGAYLPIDTEYPQDRIEYIAEDSKCSLILTQKKLIGKVPSNIQALILEDESLYVGECSNPNSSAGPNNLAYIIYTSGSTGTPKGVMLEHFGVVNTLHVLKDKYPIKDNDAYLLKTSYTFDVSVSELFGWFMGGGRLVILKHGGEKEPIEILRTVRKYQVTHLNFVPSMLRIFVQILEDSSEKPYTLKYVFSAGEALPIELAERFRYILPNISLENLYGPTETTIYATKYSLSELNDNMRIAIGKPIENTTAYIVDSNIRLQPIGVAGELCLGGAGLARGYLNRPELTAEKFADNPFEPETKMYKTGDLARWLPDGNIEFLGRIDHQVKIRGYRIELGEIENKLLSHEAVKETVVIAKDDNNGNKYLCAYIVMDYKLTIAELREHLLRDLPDYMIPSYFIQLEKLPLTSNGKVDRKALLETDGNIFIGTEYEAPRNITEEKIVKIWREILGVEKIGINDNFFDLGGHSLKATSLAAKVHKVLNIEIPLREIFKAPTIKGISEYIKGRVESIYSTIEPVKEKDYYEMSSAQKRIYTIQQFELNSTSYNMPGVLELEGDLDTERLKEVFDKLIQRHDALRTSFNVVEEGLIQKIHKKVEFDIDEYETEEEKDIEEIVKGFIKAFDLSKAPLLRVGLVKIHSNKYILMFDMHHIISDGVSMGIIVEEFSLIYAGEELTPLRIQYKDFSEWQNELFKSDKIKAQEAYWLKQFEGEIPVLNLPTDYQRPSLQSFEGDSIQFKIGKEFTDNLREIAKATGSTMYMIILSIVNILLSKYSGQEDIIVGSPIAGRPHVDLENIIGMFVNTLAMRNYPSGEKTFKELLGEVKDNALGAYENQDYQFEELVEKLSISRDFSRNPLFDVMLVMQNIDMGEVEVEGIKISPYKSENKVSKFDMTINLIELEDSIDLNLEYCTKLFNKSTIKRMYKHVENIIQEVTTNIDIKLSEIEILTEEERKQILVGFNNIRVNYPKDKTIHQLFEEQVEKTPDNIAVVYEDKQLTYSELNERANQVARQLRTMGVEEGSIVGIMVERSLEMIEGIIGILKAGGAYLPINPEYPIDRIQYTLEDSGAKVLLTESSLKDSIIYSGEILTLDEKEINNKDKTNLNVEEKSNNLAYVIYTSGTTGKPKGAMIEHRNVVSLMFNDGALFDFTEKDVWTMFHSYCFDFSVWEMYGALLYGGKLIIVPKPVTQEPKEYLKLLKMENVTVLNQTPTAFYNLSNEETMCEEKELSVRYVIFGGEALKPIVLENWRKRYPQTKLINMYGITETTVHVTYKEITEYEIENNMSNIGKPIPTLTAYVMDKNMKLLPIGVAGELCVGGDGVCRGYLNRPDLTSEKFVQNPYIEGERFYRSGDLVRMLPNGDMEYIGRIDQQVKIRGHRIEIGEIENKLLEYKDVKETVVIAKEDNNNSKYLCAYIVGERKLTISELREYLLKALPSYMIPTYFVQLDKIPLTSNGKVDRKSLPEPNGSIITGVDYEAPRNDMEKKLVEVWEQVLGIDSIGINDNFFTLGGDSIKALRLISAININLNKKLNIRSIYQFPSLKELSMCLSDSQVCITDHEKEIEKAELETLKRSISEDTEQLKKLPNDVEDFYPMSDIEQGMVYHYLKNYEDGVYHDQLLYMMKDKYIDYPALNKAIILMTDKHDILRTSFDLQNFSCPLQIVHKSFIPDVDYIDIKKIIKQEQNDYINLYMEEDRKKVFDLSKPLWRIRVFVIDDNSLVFALICHHAVLDGWSAASYVTELVNLYYKIKNKQDVVSISNKLKHSYKDYILEQMAVKKNPEMFDYWEEELKEYKRFDLKQSIRCGEGKIKTLEYDLGNERLNELTALANKQNTNIKIICFTAYLYMINMLSYENDVVVGLVEHNRPICADGDKILGCFLNTVPFRLKCDKEMTWEELIKHIHEKTTKLKQYSSLSLFEIMKCVGEGSAYDNPLFDTFFNYIDFHIINDVNKELINDNLTDFAIDSYARTNTILEFSLYNMFGTSKVKMIYEDNIFTDNEANKLLQYFKNVLDMFIKHPKKIVNKSDVFTEEERQQILTDFNNTKADYPKDKTINKLFEEQVEKTPDSIAIVFEDKQLTYRELNERTNQLARVLRDKGVVPDSIVGIMVERSIEMIVGIIGILKAGGAYLPIDTEYPQDRIEYIAEDSKCSLILTQKKLIGKVPSNIQALILEDESLYVGECSNPNSSAGPNNLAYIIYTSGSTGTPKGVMLEHFGVVNTLHVLKDKYPIKDNDAYLLKTSYTFDVSVSELFGWFMGGGRLVILKHGGEKEPMEIFRAVRKYQVTHLNFVPSMLRIFVQILEDSSEKPDTLKYVFSAGEALSVELAERFRYILPNISLENLYGPTEATIYATKYSLSELNDNMRIVIGKPIENTKAYIVDSNVRLQPIGVAGELCLSGAGLARGYLNRPELTAEKFADNPFELGTKMYKTGDLARWLPDGNIEFLGRIDNQVKIRGYRIELGEIENKLLSHEAVKETVVLARDDNSGSKYLCAYMAVGREQTVAELREYLLKELPEYMIPTYFIQLDKLPLTINGKIDRKALPEPDGNIATGAEYEAPRNITEEKLIDIWREVLGVEKIGINDNFFELGGHSLKATSLVAKIHKVLNIEVPLREIFKVPTIKGISEHIRGSKENIYSSVEPVEEKEYYEMSSAQKRMYTLQQLEPNSTSYNMPGVLELEGNVDAERLREVFSKLINRHEALRTSFGLIDEGLIQKVHKEIEFDIEQYRVESEEEIKDIVKNFIRAFDLSKTPLLRVGLVKVHLNKHILMFDMHHIISDGVSMGIMVEEFSKAYAGEELNPLRVQYKDFSEWQNKLFKSEGIKAQEEYWLRQFEGEIPVLNLPTDYQRPAVQSFEGDSIQFEIDKELTKKLSQIAKATGSTMYMVLLGTFNILLSKYSGQEDIIVGSPIAGRPHTDLDNIIGMFVNTLAMRNYPNGEKTFKEFLREVKENALGAYENQNYQFEELVEKLNIPRNFSRSPVFDVMFVLQNIDMGELTAKGLKINPYKSENMISKFDITLTAVELGNRISIGIQYCTKLFNKNTIEKMYKHLENIMQAVTENIDINLSEVEIMSKEERQQILIDFNNTKADYPKDKTIHQLFEEQVARTPDSIAVVYEDKMLTYRKLNEKANQLARVLREKKVGSESIVGIMVERSLEMIIGIMGILKAGGAYLPIDPEYPKDRIEYMLQDSETAILLTQSRIKDKVEFSGEIVELEDERLYKGNTSNIESNRKPQDIAYVIYTSGSTGKPKGVMIEDRSVVNFITGMAENIEFTSEKTILAITSISFDIFGLETLLPLTKGLRIVIADESSQKDINKLSEIIHNQKVDIIQSTPSRMRLLAENSDNNIFYNLKEMIIGGEPLSQSLLEKLRSNTKANIYNVYGPTETTIWSTLRKLSKGQIDIGKPIANTKVYIVDKHSNIVPVGVAGELCIAGEGLARGYLNRTELTKEKFVDNPFEPGTRMYRTGDLARWLPDGNIEFLGRIDNQVKIRGYRIELGEIENKLLTYDAVSDTVVIARDDNSGNKYLCAYVVGERELSISELRKHLLRVLPDYMIPSYFIQQEKLPLTPNGKVDRKALPAPDESIFTGAEYEAPRNSTEEKLVAIWRGVLGVESIGINDNFFELGGHSLRAINLAAKIQKAFDTDVSIGEIFRNPTIKEIIKVILERKNNKFEVIRPTGEREYYPVSSSQKRLYIQNQFDENNVSYNMPSLMSIEGDIDIQKFEQVFDSLIRRHEALRTSFEYIDGEIVQKIHNIKDMPYFKITYDESLIDTEKLEIEYIKPFDLTKAPLFRVALIKRDSNKYLFILDMHHIISDGISINIMVNEFMKLYTGEELPLLEIQYRDYAVWETELYQNEHKKLQEKYWLSKLDGLSNCELPITKLAPKIKNIGSEAKIKLDELTVNKIDKYCKKNRITKFTFILTAFKILLFGEINQTDICIGTPIAGRKYSGLENIIGVFLNVQIIRTKIQKKLTFTEYVKIVDETVLEAQDKQDYPYEELYAKFKDMFNYEGDSLFNIMLNYMPHQEDSNISIEGLLIEPIERDKHIVKYKTTLYVNELAKEMMLRLVYNNSLYTNESMEKILNNMDKIINTVLKNENILIENIETEIYGALDDVDINIENKINDSDFDNDDFF